MMVSTILKLVTGGLEAFWGIPILGGSLILGMAWAPLGVMFILHIITLVFSVIEKRSFHGSILGIITSCLGWIPFVGMTLHIITAIVLLIDGYRAYTK
jgi:hypothetical protein